MSFADKLDALAKQHMQEMCEELASLRAQLTAEQEKNKAQAEHISTMRERNDDLFQQLTAKEKELAYSIKTVTLYENQREIMQGIIDEQRAFVQQLQAALTKIISDLLTHPAQTQTKENNNGY